MKNMLFITYFVCVCSADEVLKDPEQTPFSDSKENYIFPQEYKGYNQALTIEKAIENIESLENIDQVEDKYLAIIKKLEDLIDSLRTGQNTDMSVNTKGVDRIITKFIGVNNKAVQKQLLILIKSLFEVSPTVSEVISTTVIDRILDIFEHEDNLGLKAHAIDIMSIWLPKNPKVQARVMKLKGLEPFYDQISKLDANYIDILLNLFNKILAEHITVRTMNKDLDSKKLYQRIGLIERISTSTVCNGILNIFQVILPVKDKKQLPTIINLMQNIKPFCLKFYKRQDQAKAVFEELKRYFNDPEINLSPNLGFNLTEVKQIVEEYVEKISFNFKDEL